MQKIKSLIVEDEILAREVLKKHIARHPQLELIGECGDGLEGFKQIQSLQPELIFLDIQMPKITGFEMLELLDQKPVVIFTTAYDEYAIKAFEYHALDYLLKPFSASRFDQAVSRATAEIEKSENTAAGLQQAILPEELQRIVVKNGTQIKIIPLQEVLYFEAWDDLVKIHTAEGYFAKKRSLQSLEELLETQGFVRIHRKYLVNSMHVNSIKNYTADTWKVFLRNQAEIQASRSGYQKLKQTLGL